MIYCHSCGKPIHETAPMCPHCGAVQKGAQVARAPVASGLSAAWIPAGSVVAGLLALLALMSDTDLDRDTLMGICVFAVAGIVLGSIGLGKSRPYRNLAMGGLILSALMLLCTLGNM